MVYNEQWNQLIISIIKFFFCLNFFQLEIYLLSNKTIPVPATSCPQLLQSQPSDDDGIQQHGSDPFQKKNLEVLDPELNSNPLKWKHIVLSCVHSAVVFVGKNFY